MVLDKITHNRKANSSWLERADLDNADELTEPDNSKESPVGRPVGRRLKRSNAIGLITIPNQAEDEEVAEPVPESGADWEMADDETPKAKKKPTKPKTRELIKAASERKALENPEYGSDDNMEGMYMQREVSTTLFELDKNK